MVRMVAFDLSGSKGIVKEGNTVYLLYSGSSTGATEISGEEVQSTISEKKLKKCDIDFKNLIDATTFLRRRFLQR